jgi:uncharacterized protein YukE
MAGGYQVNPTELDNGTKLIQGVSDQAESISNALTGTFASLVSAAGNADLANALAAVDGTCSARVLDVLALLGHIGETLGDNARSYQQAEDQNTQSLNKLKTGSAR